MAPEVDNYRAALQWAIDKKLEDAYRLAPGMFVWWVQRAPLSEARQWFVRLLHAVPSDRAPRDRALFVLADIAKLQSEFETAERWLRESDALCRAMDEARGSAYSRSSLGQLLVLRRQYAAAEPLLWECVALGRVLGDDKLVAECLGNLGVIAFESGDDYRALSLWEETLAHARSVGDLRTAANVLCDRGRIECRNGRLLRRIVVPGRLPHHTLLGTGVNLPGCRGGCWG